MSNKETGVASGRRDPFALLRHMTSDVDRMFDAMSWPSIGRSFRALSTRPGTWAPGVDVFEKDNQLITRIDLPGVKKEDVKVEVADGHLAISGERKSEAEEKKDNFYRCEREFGSFYRVVPLPEGVKLDDVKATFADGVLEVSVPIPAKAEATPRKVEIQEPVKAAKPAA